MTPFSLFITSLPLKKSGPCKSMCNVVLNHNVAKHIIPKLVRKKIGDGSSVLSWHDLWAGDSSLEVVCPHLFLLSQFPNATVNSFQFWDGNSWQWSLLWKWPLRPRDVQENSTLNLLLVVWFFYINGWTSSSEPLTRQNRIFSVKVYSMEQAKAHAHHNADAVKGLWCWLVPYRIEIFVWSAILGRLNTKAKLANLGIISASNSDLYFLTYIFCNKHQES